MTAAQRLALASKDLEQTMARVVADRYKDHEWELGLKLSIAMIGLQFPELRSKALEFLTQEAEL